MKHALLSIVLALAGMGGNLYAQCGNNKSVSKSDMTFNLGKWFITNRHIAYLESGNKMTVELFYIKDYYLLGNLDSLVRGVMEDVSFYKDSLDAAGTNNLRIDYAVTRDNKFKKMRFTVHRTGESTFVKSGNKLSSLKMEQDTIRIKISSEELSEHYPDCISLIEQKKITEITHPIQITFVLNSYSDIYDLAKGNELSRIIDTFKTHSGIDKPYRRDANNVSTIFYKPYSQEKDNLIFKYMLLDDKGEKELNRTLKRDQVLVGTFGVGASLVRNNLTPIMNFGLEYQRRWIGTKKDYRSYSLYASPYYFFSKRTDGKYATHISWFLNVERGHTHKDEDDDRFREISVGAGYLLNPDGKIFERQTVKGYFAYTFKAGITVCPELIITNNFRNFIPAFTIRLFSLH
ncbi:MAG: hypothetical protein JNL72_02240 [Flavipsychrobacter sp.]|nr:hypothetical protein [Flavipsychrobacter sp.]